MLWVLIPTTYVFLEKQEQYLPDTHSYRDLCIYLCKKHHDPDMKACNEPSGQDLHCLNIVILAFDWHHHLQQWTSKLTAGSGHFRNLGVKGLMFNFPFLFNH